jgi:hypothetical protein
MDLISRNQSAGNLYRDEKKRMVAYYLNSPIKETEYQLLFETRTKCFRLKANQHCPLIRKKIALSQTNNENSENEKGMKIHWINPYCHALLLSITLLVD